MQEHAKRSGLIVIVSVCQVPVGAWEVISLSTCKNGAKSHLGFSRAKTALYNTWRGEGLLYTNIYQALTFDQSCTCSRVYITGLFMAGGAQFLE